MTSAIWYARRPPGWNPPDHPPVVPEPMIDLDDLSDPIGCDLDAKGTYCNPGEWGTDINGHPIHVSDCTSCERHMTESTIDARRRAQQAADHVKRYQPESHRT